MKYYSIKNGERIPVLGLGTWRLGGSLFPDYSQDKQSVKTIQAAIELGYTHIDTAEIYGDGHTEELIGRAIQGFPRRDLFIATKVWHTHLSYADTHAAVKKSLKRLHCDYIDLCLVHWPNDNIPFNETFTALNELVEAGEVRYLGVSNFDLEGLRTAQTLSASPILTVQVPYSLYNRSCVTSGVLAYCLEQDILLTAHSPFDRGDLLNNPELRNIAAHYGKTPAQIALYWLIQQPNVITIPMSSNPEHLRSNMEALDLELSARDLEILNTLELPEETLWPE
jgi:diketogulonate reductase-like aldo/keto reductase